MNKLQIIYAIALEQNVDQTVHELKVSLVVGAAYYTIAQILIVKTESYNQFCIIDKNNKKKKNICMKVVHFIRFRSCFKPIRQVIAPYITILFSKIVKEFPFFFFVHFYPISVVFPFALCFLSQLYFNLFIKRLGF